MPDATLAARFALIFASLLQTGVYALAIYLSFYLVSKIDFKSSFSRLTPLLGLILVLFLTPFIFSPLSFIFQKLLDPLLNQAGGLLHPLEGLFLIVILWYIWRSFSKGGES